MLKSVCREAYLLRGEGGHMMMRLFSVEGGLLVQMEQWVDSILYKACPVMLNLTERLWAF